MRAAFLTPRSQWIQHAPMPLNEELRLWQEKQFWKRCSLILGATIVLMLVSLWALIEIKCGCTILLEKGAGNGVPQVEWEVTRM